MSENCSHNCSECGQGGVGKSLVTSMLAVLTQHKGYRMAILV